MNSLSIATKNCPKMRENNHACNSPSVILSILPRN
nr:MAG TPA: hypothetical protein [Caudoviricetes sp.]